MVLDELFNQQPGDAQQAVSRGDHQGSQFMRPIAVRLDLGAANHLAGGIHRDYKPLPIQSGWVQAGAPNQATDRLAVILASFSNFDRRYHQE